MKIDALQIKVESDEINAEEVESITIKIGSSSEGDVISIEFDDDGEIKTYTKILHTLTGWPKIKALIKCALFGHNEDFILAVPIYIYDEWKMFEAKTDFCSRCNFDFKKEDTIF